MLARELTLAFVILSSGCFSVNRRVFTNAVDIQLSSKCMGLYYAHPSYA